MSSSGVRLGIGVAGTGLVLASSASWAVAGGERGNRDGDGGRASSISEHLTGYEETEFALSTTGNGRFRARVNPQAGEISWSLRYADLEGAVQQAHIHFGAKTQSGGVSAFLCSNLGNGPAGTPACPAAPGFVEGVITAVDVLGPSGQGIAAGEIGELFRAIDAEATYVNVHTELYPSGEIRAQLEPDDDHDHDHD